MSEPNPSRCSISRSPSSSETNPITWIFAIPGPRIGSAQIPAGNISNLISYGIDFSPFQLTFCETSSIGATNQVVKIHPSELTGPPPASQETDCPTTIYPQELKAHC